MYSQSAKIVLLGLIAFLSVTQGREQKVTLDDARFLVQIQDGFGLRICAAALVSRDVVLSTTQCVGSSAEGLFVAVGAATRSGEAQKFAIKAWHARSGVMVIELGEKVPEVMFKDIKLCSKPLKKGDEIETTGFGAGGQFWGNMTDSLNRGFYTVIPRDECVELYKTEKYETEVPENSFCADEFRNIVGEYGTPAVHNGELCGLVAAGTDGHPGIFTSIYPVKDFVEETIKA